MGGDSVSRTLHGLGASLRSSGDFGASRSLANGRDVLSRRLPRPSRPRKRRGATSWLAICEVLSEDTTVAYLITELALGVVKMGSTNDTQAPPQFRRAPFERGFLTAKTDGAERPYVDGALSHRASAISLSSSLLLASTRREKSWPLPHREVSLRRSREVRELGFGSEAVEWERDVGELKAAQEAWSDRAHGQVAYCVAGST